eukprot:scaffold27239_cov86-Phaeocystis_antarctica.AAC.1
MWVVGCRQTQRERGAAAALCQTRTQGRQQAVTILGRQRCAAPAQSRCCAAAIGWGAATIRSRSTSDERAAPLPSLEHG